MQNSKPTSVRISDKDQVLIDRAAMILGVRKSEFIVRSARDTAANTILDERILVASPAQFEQIQAYLDSHQPNALLEQALEKSRNNPLW